MAAFLIIVNVFIFFSLSCLHWYWVFGGKWAAGSAVPTKISGKKVFSPGKIATSVIALNLLVFVIVTVSNRGIFSPNIDMTDIHYATVGIGVLFILRGIGDFKYIGITKRIKSTQFGIKDTKIYTPLCFVIGIISFAIVVLS